MRTTVAVVLCLLGFACASRHLARVDELSYGDPCGEKTVCRTPLVCGPSNTCEASHALGAGESCVISDDCAKDLWCDHGSCATAGDGDVGAVCMSSGECLSGLRCAFLGLGGSCIDEGNQYLDDPCSNSKDCLAGLVCAAGSCQPDWQPPAGATCDPTSYSDTTCEASPGFVCDPASKVCKGLGPDEMPIVPWAGASCPSPQGPFRVLFTIGYGGDDFYRLPYPNDIRLSSGSLDLTGFPHPPAASVPTDFVGRLLGASSSLDGFGPNETVFLRFSVRPRLCTECDAGDSACKSTCVGDGASDPPFVYVADITPGVTSPWATPYSWYLTTASHPYVCGPFVAVIPSAVAPWLPGHTYAVFVHTRITDKDGASMTQDTDFAAMLQSSAPADAVKKAAWDAYQPLRDWLASSPTYTPSDPDGGNPVLAAHLGAAAVFTVRDPTKPMVALADAIANAAAPAISDVSACATASDTCSDPLAQSFVEVQGIVELPIFQEGTAPYVDVGGGIALDKDGNAVEQRKEQVRFSLSLPAGAGPWPVLIYAHGTGGDYRSHIREGVAEALASFDSGGTSVGFAVIGFDQVAHGPRAQGSSLSPELLFFNINNPAAARGNVLQGAADLLSVQKALGELQTQLVGLAGAGGANIDPSQVAFLGHSQGAAVGVPAMAVADGVGAVVLSGAGGGLIDTLGGKTSPYDLTQLLPLLLADHTLPPSGNFDPGVRRHPAVSLLQSFMEEADATNYAPFVSSQDLAGRGVAAKNVLQIVGAGDTYAPNVTALTLARRIGVDFLDDDGSALVASGVVSAPVRANIGGLTRVSSIHVPASGDGHFVLFNAGDARLRAQQFFGTWQTDSGGIPTVVP